MRHTMTKTCTICGSTFESVYPQALYCCPECRLESNRQRAKRLSEAAKREQIPEASTVKCSQTVKKKCKYGLYGAKEWTCDYIEIAGERRGCPSSACTRFVPDPKRSRGKQKYVKSLSIKY